MIFSRGKHSRGRHAVGRREPPDVVDDEDDLLTEPAEGPFDITDAPDGVPRLDLGSLQIPAVDGVEVRVQASPEGAIQQVVLVHGENALQLGAFAAPRSEGIWDEIREEIRGSLFDEGVAVEEVPGRYGIELRARVRTPDGMNDLRFVGIDGPRWMVRAVFQGAAAVDPDAASLLSRCLSGLVVDRGHEAMPVREGLPLRLPKEMTPDPEPEPVPEPVPLDLPANGGPPTGRRKPSPRPRR